MLIQIHKLEWTRTKYDIMKSARKTGFDRASACVRHLESEMLRGDVALAKADSHAIGSTVVGEHELVPVPWRAVWPRW